MATRPAESQTPGRQHQAEGAVVTSSGFSVIKLSNNKAQMDMQLRLRSVPLNKNPRGYQEKLFIGLTNYDQSHKSPSVYLNHALDGPVFRMLAQVIIGNTFPSAIQSEMFGKEPICKVVESNGAHFYQWKEFKGGPDRREGGKVISRTLTITFNDTPGHRYPWTVGLTRGPGKANATGAVMPAGQPTHKVQIQLSPVQMHQWMLLGSEALQALTTVQMLRAPLLTEGLIE